MPTEATALPGAIRASREEELIAGICRSTFPAPKRPSVPGRLRRRAWKPNPRLNARRRKGSANEPRRAAGASATDRNDRRHRRQGLSLLQGASFTGAARMRASGSTSRRRGSAFARSETPARELCQAPSARQLCGIFEGVEVKSGRRSSSKTGGNFGLLRS